MIFNSLKELPTEFGKKRKAPARPKLYRSNMMLNPQLLKKLLILIFFIGCSVPQKNIIIFDNTKLYIPSRYQYMEKSNFDTNSTRFLDKKSLKTIVIENRMKRSWESTIQRFKKEGMILKNHNLYHIGYIPVHYYTYDDITMYIAYGKKNIAIFYEFDNIDEVKEILKLSLVLIPSSVGTDTRETITKQRYCYLNINSLRRSETAKELS